jgi:hypothetical protein
MHCELSRSLTLDWRIRSKVEISRLRELVEGQTSKSRAEAGSVDEVNRRPRVVTKSKAGLAASKGPGKVKISESAGIAMRSGIFKPIARTRSAMMMSRIRSFQRGNAGKARRKLGKPARGERWTCFLVVSLAWRLRQRRVQWTIV